jgi:uncharacterized protein
MKANTILKPEIKKIVDATLQHILSAGKPYKVFLFGSYARGEENEDSDMDFYIVEDLSIRKESNAAKYYKALFQLNHAKDVIVRSPTDFEKNKAILNTLEYDVYKDGIVLYERK